METSEKTTRPLTPGSLEKRIREVRGLFIVPSGDPPEKRVMDAIRVLQEAEKDLCEGILPAGSGTDMDELEEVRWGAIARLQNFARARRIPLPRSTNGMPHEAYSPDKSLRSGFLIIMQKVYILWAL